VGGLRKINLSHFGLVKNNSASKQYIFGGPVTSDDHLLPTTALNQIISGPKLQAATAWPPPGYREVPGGLAYWDLLLT